MGPLENSCLFLILTGERLLFPGNVHAAKSPTSNPESIMKFICILPCIAMFCVNLTAQSLFQPDSGTMERLKRDPQMKQMTARAEQTLKAKALPADRTLEKGVSYSLYLYYVGTTLTRWMEDLGYSYLVTKEERYARKGVELLTATCRDFPVTHPRIVPGMPGERGQILYGIAMGCTFFMDHLSPEEKALIEKNAGDYIDSTIQAFHDPNTWYYEIHNHNGVAFGPAGMVCLLFREKAEYQKRLMECIRLLKRWINASFDEYGLPAEGSSYARYSALRTMLFAMQLRECGGEDLFRTTRLGKWPHAYLAKQIPGTRLMDTRNDNYYAPPGLECLYVAIACQDPVSEWIWENYATHGNDFPLEILLEARKRPKASLDFSRCPKSVFFPQRHFAIWRTGWGREDVMFSIEAGPFITSSKGRGITHAQADKGHFCLYAFGDMWAVDTGYANDAGPNPKFSRSHTFAHSCVLIDGRGQARSGNGLGVSAKILKFEDSPVYGYAKADCTPAYKSNNRGERGAGAERALREVLFIRPSHGVPAYAVVLDDIRKDREKHTFTWQMMLLDNKKIELRKNGALIRNENTFPAVVSTPAGAPKGSAVWNLNLKKETEYSIWGFFRAGGARPPASDSFFLQLDQQKPFLWDLAAPGDFSWRRITEKVDPKKMYHAEQKAKMFSFSGTTHAIALLTREHDAEVKALFLGNTPDATPFSGNGRFLSAADAKLAGGMTRRLEKPENGKNSCAVFLNAAVPLRMRVDTFCPVNPRPPAVIQRLRADAECINPNFAAVLVPLRDGMREPQVSFTRPARGKTRITLEWGNAHDTIVWDTEKTEKRVSFRRSL